MDWNSAFGLAAIVGLVLANGFFVATEFAIVAVRRSRLEQLVKEGRMGAQAALDVVAHLDAYIAATQFGITLASLALGWIGEPALATLLEPAAEWIFGQHAVAAAHGMAFAVAFALITGLHIVLGELAPKGLALQRPETTALWVARPIRIFHAVFKWPITGLNAIGNATLRMIGLRPAAGHEMVHTIEELRVLLTGMQEAGVVPEAQAQIARRAFAFGEMNAGALMTPRTEVEAIPVETPLDGVLTRAETTRHTCLPVFDGSLDNIVGILHLRDLFRYRNTRNEQFDLRSLLRAPLIVPELKDAAELLENMRATRRDIAIVIDEYGGMAGLITFDNLLEALVGAIATGRHADKQREPDGSMLLDGLMRLDEFVELSGAHIDARWRHGVETLGGLVAAVLGRFPSVGEEIAIGGRLLRVEARDGLRVSMLRLLAA